MKKDERRKNKHLDMKFQIHLRREKEIHFGRHVLFLFDENDERNEIRNEFIYDFINEIKFYR